MNNKLNSKKIILLFSFFFALATTTHAQQAIAAAGGQATGASGSVSYTIGQVFYTAHTGAGGSLNQGVQQPASTPVAAPTASNQSFCQGATVANLVATGTALQWYDVNSGGAALATNTVLVSGNYYVSQTVGGIESSRTTVAVTVNANVTYYADADGDGYGNPAVSQVSCTGAPAGYIANSTDCNDANATVHPGAVEVCGDGIDNDCNGIVDETCLTQLVSFQHNTTLPTLDYPLYVNKVTGASMYRYEVTNAGNSRTFESPKTATNYGYLFLSNLSGGGAYSTTYTIRVAVQIGGQWGSYGAVKTFTTPAAVTTTKLLTSQCGSTLPALNAPIWAIAMSQATDYRFEVTPAGGAAQTIDVVAPVNYVYLSQLVGGGVYATTYAVRIMAKINGTWGDYGASCNVTTPVTVTNSKVFASQCGTTLASNSSYIFADAVGGVTGYRFEVTNVTLGTPPVTFDAMGAGHNYFKLTQIPGGVANATVYSIRVAVQFGGNWQDYGSACNVSTPAPGARVNETASTSVFAVSGYPNPFENSFNLSLESNSKSNVTINVYDMIGRQVETREVQAEELINTTLGTNYAAGVYNIIVSQDTNVKTIRMIKK